ncbi:DUF397 domain-containing protein [Peterkaempfera griseoplana]|uniref:DUF397 domain-containing protein n=1 Tax=Peterkaempfera griseoplana TaxID=66896 RepID=UPI00099E3E68|nr:DUF397 domain-containing protein [Peterkaempfera griseoplana]
MSTDGLTWFKSSHSGTEGGACVEVGVAWRKSSHSGTEGGNCVEVAAAWRKSSHSGTGGGDCVEVAPCPGTVHVRDSKDPDGPCLTFTPAAWTAFVAFAATAPLAA